jgi:F-type H+-transporting ATPase subunit b
VLAFLRFAESTEEAANPILPVASEMFWGAISFAALFALVKYVLLPPVLGVMEERAAKVRSDLDAAEVARSRAGSAASEVQDQLSGVRAEAAAVVDAARAEAEEARAAVMAEAEARATAIRDAGAAEIANAREEALAGVTPQVSELAADAASRVMNRQIGLSEAQPVVDRFLQNPN